MVWLRTAIFNDQIMTALNLLAYDLQTLPQIDRSSLTDQQWLEIYNKAKPLASAADYERVITFMTWRRDCLLENNDYLTKQSQDSNAVTTIKRKIASAKEALAKPIGGWLGISQKKYNQTKQVLHNHQTALASQQTKEKKLTAYKERLNLLKTIQEKEIKTIDRLLLSCKGSQRKYHNTLELNTLAALPRALILLQTVVWHAQDFESYLGRYITVSNAASLGVNLLKQSAPQDGQPQEINIPLLEQIKAEQEAEFQGITEGFKALMNEKNWSNEQLSQVVDQILVLLVLAITEPGLSPVLNSESAVINLLESQHFSAGLNLLLKAVMPFVEKTSKGNLQTHWLQKLVELQQKQGALKFSEDYSVALTQSLQAFFEGKEALEVIEETKQDQPVEKDEKKEGKNAEVLAVDPQDVLASKLVNVFEEEKETLATEETVSSASLSEEISEDEEELDQALVEEDWSDLLNQDDLMLEGLESLDLKTRSENEFSVEESERILAKAEQAANDLLKKHGANVNSQMADEETNSAVLHQAEELAEDLFKSNTFVNACNMEEEFSKLNALEEKNNGQQSVAAIDVVLSEDECDEVLAELNALEAELNEQRSDLNTELNEDNAAYTPLMSSSLFEVAQLRQEHTALTPNSKPTLSLWRAVKVMTGLMVAEGSLFLVLGVVGVLTGAAATGGTPFAFFGMGMLMDLGLKGAPLVLTFAAAWTGVAFSATSLLASVFYSVQSGEKVDHNVSTTKTSCTKGKSTEPCSLAPKIIVLELKEVQLDSSESPDTLSNSMSLGMGK